MSDEDVNRKRPDAQSSQPEERSVFARPLDHEEQPTRRGWNVPAGENPPQKPADDAAGGREPGPTGEEPAPGQTAPGQIKSRDEDAAAAAQADPAPNADPTGDVEPARNADDENTTPAAGAVSASSASASSAGAPDADDAGRPENPFAPPAEQKRRGLFGRRTAAAAGDPGSADGSGSARPAPKRRRSRRNLAAIVVSIVAGAAILTILISYAIWNTGRTQQEATAPPAPVLSASPGPVLSDALLLDDGMAKSIDDTRTWTTELTQSGVPEGSNLGAACLGPQPSGQPTPEITLVRGLTASGDDGTAALHRADSFATPEEATQVFNFRANELGGCAGSPLYIEKGMSVTGLGNQALGVRVVLQETKPEYHSIVLVRTGRVVDIVDVTRMEKAADMAGIVTALTQVVNRQCGPAVGLCAAPKPQVTETIPPPGGDQPGLLAVGDIPRVSPGVGEWRGGPTNSRVDVQDGSGCESIDFNTVGGTQDRKQRTYLLRNDPQAPSNPPFGVDEVVLTMGNDADAYNTLTRVVDSVRGCGTRTLTSQVTQDAGMETPGLGGLKVVGNWFVVNQKVDATNTQKYRVAILSAGPKVIYLRSNPSDQFDFTDAAWIAVALRAGERATQVR